MWKGSHQLSLYCLLSFRNCTLSCVTQLGLETGLMLLELELFLFVS
jgi:hypothetical protein